MEEAVGFGSKDGTALGVKQLNRSSFETEMYYYYCTTLTVYLVKIITYDRTCMVQLQPLKDSYTNYRTVTALEGQLHPLKESYTH